MDYQQELVKICNTNPDKKLTIINGLLISAMQEIRHINNHYDILSRQEEINKFLDYVHNDVVQIIGVE